MFSDTYLQAFDSVVKKLGVSAYLCGGTVRDLLLNRPLRDVDVVLSGRVFEAASHFASILSAPHFVLDEERKVARIVAERGNWDFTGFRNSNIDGDLRKRDFTINAIAIRWEDFYPGRNLQHLIDPFHGMSDLSHKILRPVTSESLRDDPLRMLRAFRIQSELKFKMDESVYQDVERLHPLIADVAAERITEEFDRIFQQADSATAWKMLGDTSLFDSIFPEMKPMKGCEQGGYHHLDVWQHSVLALEIFETFLTELPQHFPQHLSFLQEYLNAVPGTLDRTRLLKWALLLHDIGKPATKELREPGRWQFHGHDHTGADIAERLLKRLKFARKDIQLICAYIEHHLRPLNYSKVADKTPEITHRMFRATGTEGPGVLLISYGDMAAAQGALADPGRIPKFLQMLRDLLDYYVGTYLPAVNTPEILKGRDLMAVLQMKPGPLMGELLAEVREAQLAGKLSNRNDALDFAMNWLKNRN